MRRRERSRAERRARRRASPADGEPRGHRPRASAGLGSLLPLATCALLSAGCNAEWGGARFAIQDPAPPPPPDEEVEASSEPDPLPLPEGPLLYLVRPVGPRTARVTPVAALPPGGGAPRSLEFPRPLPPEFRARFDSAFLRPGTELALQRWGRRVASVVLSAAPTAPDSACPGVVEARLLVVPGQELPTLSPALPPDLSPAIPEPVPSLEPSSGMNLAAPVIAERHIGGNRAYLARRVSLEALLGAGDTATAMAATYLIADSLAPGPPTGDAISLFFLADSDPRRGYVTRWSELRRYDSADRKEAFVYLDWSATPRGRLHLLRLYDGRSARLAAGFVSEDEEEPALEWREDPRCPALARLEAS